MNGVTNTSTGETAPRPVGAAQYLGGQTVWKHVGVSTGESSGVSRGPSSKRGAERWAEWHRAATLWGKLASRAPRPGPHPLCMCCWPRSVSSVTLPSREQLCALGLLS